jgi:uncharacterized protein (DUF1697 family)
VHEWQPGVWQCSETNRCGREAVRYIAFLRGINVGGRKIASMTDVKKVFESLSFENVRTYAQSGNVIFDCERAETTKMAMCVEEKLRKTFGFSTNVIIRTQRELESIIEKNPLIGRADIWPDKLYVTFLSATPDKTVASSLDIKPGKGEKFLIVGTEAYLYCPTGYARTTLNNAMFETKLKTAATTRNWKMINKLLIISKLS